MNDWILHKLSGLVNFPVPEEIICLIHQMPNDRDLDNYMESFLDLSNLQHREFLLELKRKRAQDAVLSGYRKFNDYDRCEVKPKDKKKNRSKEMKDKDTAYSPQPKKIEKFAEKQKKTSNFYSESKKNSSVLAKSRSKCNCEAKTHGLINNCLNCGRIVCIQEGIGPCFFCGNQVYTEDESAILFGQTSVSNLLHNKEISQKLSIHLGTRLEQRNKLLEYDRDSTKRTQVIDDECDYYNMSNDRWLSKSERHEMIQKNEKQTESKYTLRIKKNITLDLYNQTVLVEDGNSNQNPNPIVQINKNYQSNTTDLLCPNFSYGQPKYVNHVLPGHGRPRHIHDFASYRVQDKEIMEMVDEGFCMSVQQPHASLLVSGIELHVGKSWYSSYRGRLWIHAASRALPSEEIKTANSNLETSKKNQETMFPNAFNNTNILLGFVTIVEILSQLEYRKKFPEGNSDSAYVLICADSYKISMPIPMQGKQKIYKLENTIHKAALKSFEKSPKVIDV